MHGLYCTDGDDPLGSLDIDLRGTKFQLKEGVRDFLFTYTQGGPEKTERRISDPCLSKHSIWLDRESF